MPERMAVAGSLDEEAFEALGDPTQQDMLGTGHIAFLSSGCDMERYQGIRR